MCGLRLVRRKYDKSYSENILYKELRDSQRNKARLREILRHKRGGRLLEVGCAKGGFLKLAREHFDVEGMDISQYVIDAIRTTFGKRVQAGNIETAQLLPERYDVIAAFNVLEHLRDPGSVIQKAYGSLRRGGILIGSVPNNRGPVGRPLTRLSNLLDRTHCSTYPPGRWRRIFEQARFSKVVFFGEMNFGRNLCIYVKRSLWKYISPNLMFLCVK